MECHMQMVSCRNPVLAGAARCLRLTRVVRRFLVALPLLALSCFAQVSVGQAATLTVCPAGCDSTSIQGAITLAQSGDTVSLISSLPHTESDISVIKDIEIVGQGLETTIIQADSTAGTAPTRVFWVFPGVTAVFRDMHIRHGNVVDGSSGGGCILNEGVLEMIGIRVTACEVSLSTDPSAATDGGAIFNDGVLSLRNVQVSESEGTKGGAIFNAGSLSAVDCVIEDNSTTGDGTVGQAGGLFNAVGASATLSNCRVAGNVGPSFTTGGGIINRGDLDLIDSVVNGNSRNGIHSSAGSLHVLATRIHLNGGAGLIFGGSGTLLVRNSTISKNDGGGLRFCGDDPGSVVNSTISGNVTAGDGGGIHVCASRKIRIASSTIANNVAALGGAEDGDGGGIYLEPPSNCDPICIVTRAQIRNSIVAANLDDSPDGFRTAHDCDGTLQSDGYNLIEEATIASGLGVCKVDGDLTGVILGQDPQLQSLADNLGTTPTHALQSGSPAINAGNPSGCTDFNDQLIDTDQRGALRAGTCDMGSFEFGSIPDNLFSDRFELVF